MNSVTTVVYTLKYVHQTYQAVVQIHRTCADSKFIYIFFTRLKKHDYIFQHTLHFGHSYKHQSLNPFQNRLPAMLCVGMKVFTYYKFQKCNGKDSSLDPGSN